ncbi:pyruvate dehydrogenase E2 component (dihydrolipoamide acetyltransferase) [Alkalihalobacillus xiaoxiensis]|uniref:Dihydrolipoamide acetyltransferase component of pyruvate dehydrogenase complex n=1 Tax=Shouchella xiaoxiensis TaxID=766895 RepID=A0ABS2SX27_9BACI|nr:dihydrolipoamide acetyltransferase family protein [Shouchella xiaoxiensis]MBM7840085.1 pyruvate dehydrogenase E2 component (dihydrolipoamide acetyltransferase) [Shouchella xiaoxiensis]
MIEVKLHDIGEGMSEGEILHYFVKIGDSVKMDQPLVEVQTDKVAAELSAPKAGVVKEILAEPGQTVKVGTTLVVLESDTENSTIMTKTAPITVEKETTGKAMTFRRVLAAPYTRKIARENQIDIEEVVGSGINGRVIDEDLYALLEGTKKPKQPEKQAKPTPELRSSSYFTEKPKKERIIPYNGRRKQIAVKMAESVYTIPHVTHFEEADLTALMSWRKACKETGLSFSLGAYFIKALVISLKEHPIFNSMLDEKQDVIRLLDFYNIGLATNAPDGLIVPVIKNVDQKSIMEIDQEMKELTKRAQTNELKGEDLRGGTFTVSNVGPLGSTGATPIINAPQTALLAIHKTKRRPIVTKDDQIAIGEVMTMSMSFDHRIADGAQAVAFTNRWVELLEDPKRLVLELV